MSSNARTNSYSPAGVMDTLLQDIRYAARGWSKHPLIAGVIIAVIGVSIGLNSTVFTLVNALLLRPLPYQNSERLIRVDETNARMGGGPTQTSFLSFSDLRARARQDRSAFLDVAAFREEGFNVVVRVEAERVNGAAVSADLFRVLGARSIAGRVFTADEDQQGANLVVVISDDLWQRWFARSADAVGARIAIDGQSHTVIGVMPRGFHFDEYADLWVPLGPRVQHASRVLRDDRSISVIARLRDGSTLAAAEQDMAAFGRELAQRSPDTHTDWTFVARPFGSGRDDGLGSAALLMMGAVAFVLLIACANVANLMLSRAAAREREIATRLVLGARRVRVVRQLLTEGALLAVAGAVLGALLAVWSVPVVVAGLFPVESLPAWLHFDVDRAVLTFTAAVSMATVLLFGLAPALHGSRLDLSSSIKGGAQQASGSISGRRLRAILVASQVTLSLVLLVGASLMVRSVLGLRAFDRGFDSRDVLTLKTTLPSTTYRDSAALARYAELVTERLAVTAGVEGVGISGGAVNPGAGMLPRDLQIQSAQPPDEEATRLVRFETVTPGYFGALRIPVRRGRGFAPDDRAGSSAVAVVNEAMARRFWPDADPLGMQLRVNSRDPASPWITVVGVVGDVRLETIDSRGLRAEGRPEFYLPFAQSPARLLNVMLRARGEAGSLDAAVRRELAAIDRAIPLYQMMSMERASGTYTRFLRGFAVLLAVFGAIALVLSAVGVYGVVSYAVARRTREIGIRLALGATARDVLRLIVRQGMRSVVVGVATGLVIAFGLTRLLAFLLFDVNANDVGTFAGVTLVLSGVALAANAIPAWRASRIEPLAALRVD